MRITETYERPHTTAENGADDQNVVGLLKQLRDDVMLLTRQEVALAKQEVTEKAGVVGRNVGYLAIGGVVALLAGIFLMTALTTGLAAIFEAMGWEQASQWLAPLIVGAVLALVGYGLIQKALHTLKHETLVPEKTIESLKEDKQWIVNKAK